MTRLTRKRDREDGAAAVEFALVIPFLLLVVFGIIAFGLLLFAQISATHAAREGARLAAVGVDSCGEWSDEVEQRAGGADTSSITMSPVGGGSLEVGDSVVVEVTYTIKDNEQPGIYGALEAVSSIVQTTPGVGLIFPETLTATAESRVEVVGDATSC